MLKKHVSIALFSLIFLCACGPITTVRPDGVVERHYLGYVKIIVPDSYSRSSSVSASDVTTFGIRIENGIGFGYFHDQEIVTPLDCRLVVLVRDKQQLDEIIHFFETNLGGQDVCAGVH